MSSGERDALAGTVAVEPLEAFLAAAGAPLAGLLDAEERWARAHLPHYLPRPEALRFPPGVQGAALRTRFLEALRVNPTVLLALPAAPRAAPLEVVAAASDEPDQGFDIGLFEDSGTPYGARYGFGPLPFGNPTLSFATQAPFHMGFFYESRLLTALAPALLRTYPELRIHQFAALARFAFAGGHPYWGWRLLGWGLHYVQDLTQPYHATASPGTSVATLVGLSLLDLVGVHAPRAERLQLLTNRHLALEAYQGAAVADALAHSDAADPLLAALRDANHDAAYAPFDDAAPRARVAEIAHEKAARTDAALVAALPARWVKDPRHHAGAAGVEMDVWGELARHGTPEARAAMAALLRDLLADLGGASRSYCAAVLAPGDAARTAERRGRVNRSKVR
ncbi:MAG TPA: hypothetical protein VF400_06300 [Anaeromyxobacteraceae bacterium]